MKNRSLCVPDSQSALWDVLTWEDFRAQQVLLPWLICTLKCTLSPQHMLLERESSGILCPRLIPLFILLPSLPLTSWLPFSSSLLPLPSFYPNPLPLLHKKKCKIECLYIDYVGHFHCVLSGQYYHAAHRTTDIFLSSERIRDNHMKWFPNYILAEGSWV